MDLVLLGMLLVQVVSGIYNAVVYPWVTSWFAASVSPYLWTLVQLNPDYSSIAAMPWSVKLHMVNAFLVIGIMPYTRMAHVLVVPNQYLWRKYQVVRWYRAPGVPFQPNLEQVTAMKPVVTDSVLNEPPK
jgi:nitrate reductase gamma subunit